MKSLGRCNACTVPDRALHYTLSVQAVAQFWKMNADQSLSTIDPVADPLRLIQWIDRLPEMTIRDSVIKSLHNLPVACHVGCPTTAESAQFDPLASMHRVIGLLGGLPIPQPILPGCSGGICGRDEILLQVRRIHEIAAATGAEVLCLAFPFCHGIDELRPGEMDPTVETSLPVLYLTQMIGLAIGLPRQSLGLQSHFVPVEPVLRRIDRG